MNMEAVGSSMERKVHASGNKNGVSSGVFSTLKPP